MSVGERHILTLTPKGAEIAESICQRLDTVQCLLESLGVPEEIAAQDALKIERELSQQSYQAFCQFRKENGKKAWDF